MLIDDQEELMWFRPLLRAIFDNVWPKIEILVGQQLSGVHDRGLIVKV